ncbi:MAG TPA: molybdopterin molybdotransferase MoeA, partial [Woeseiaceae bacterium]|nr:molybdopterin molybdotransferase MoeA [Woeseiaceae bacterium]
PAADNSAMDGYALSTRDLVHGQGALPLSARIRAGDAPAPLTAGTAARIFTGGEIPAGADAVVMQENCEEHDGKVQIKTPVRSGQNIRCAGEDFRQGDEILRAGSRLRPQDLGLLAAAGIDRADVVRRPIVAVLSTGDELIPPGQARRPGQTYDSNGPLLRGLVAQTGCTVLPLFQVPDTPDRTRQALIESAANADLVISSGGVSVGESDHVRKALEAIGQLKLWRISVKPGKPLAFGVIKDTPFIGLPGNPVAVFVTFCLFAAPLIRKLQGRHEWMPEPHSVAAAFASPGSSREEYLRVRVEHGHLLPYPHQGSGVLSSVVWADGLARIHAGQVVAEGSMLDFFHFDALLQ